MPDSFPFARRTDWELTSNQYSATLKDLKESGSDILDLTESNPTRCSFTYPNHEIFSGLSDESGLAYDPTARGHLEARKAVSRYYAEKGQDVEPDRIFLTSSTSEAYSFIFRLLANAGDNIFFPSPSYPLFTFLADLNDVRVEAYNLVYQDRWHIDFNRLAERISEWTKGIVLVNPNNPTGSFVSNGEAQKINALCRERGIALISDEVFADFPIHADKNRVSLVNNAEALTFVLGGLSKTLALPQMKLSWIILSGPPAFVAQATERLEVIADTYLSVNTPVQNALAGWLALRSGIQDELHGRLRTNIQNLQEQCAQAPGCAVLNTEGGWYAVLRIPESLPEEELVLTLLRDDHVAVHPGYFFDFAQEGYVVLSLLPCPETFQEGVSKIFARILKMASAQAANPQKY